MPTEVAAAPVVYGLNAPLFVGEDTSCDVSSTWIVHLTCAQLQFPSLSVSSSFLAKLFTEHFHYYLTYFPISY